MAAYKPNTRLPQTVHWKAKPPFIDAADGNRRDGIKDRFEMIGKYIADDLSAAEWERMSAREPSAWSWLLHHRCVYHPSSSIYSTKHAGTTESYVALAIVDVIYIKSFSNRSSRIGR